MKWPSWIPWLGWCELDDEIIEEIGLDARWKWRGLTLEWFGAGMVLWGKAYE